VETGSWAYGLTFDQHSYYNLEGIVAADLTQEVALDSFKILLPARQVFVNGRKRWQGP
jgi:hypothetical protein